MTNCTQVFKIDTYVHLQRTDYFVKSTFKNHSKHVFSQTASARTDIPILNTKKVKYTKKCFKNEHVRGPLYQLYFDVKIPFKFYR